MTHLTQLICNKSKFNFALTILHAYMLHPQQAPPTTCSTYSMLHPQHAPPTACSTDYMLLPQLHPNTPSHFILYPVA